MAGLVTKETNKSVSDFIESLGNASKIADSNTLLSMISEITNEKAKIWGDNFIIGFGKYTYQRKGGKEVFEWFHVGFAPRKTKITIYLSFDINAYPALTEKLGKCKWGKGCLYINKLADINLDTLKEMITLSYPAQQE